jgi:hypothetical protein
VVRWIIAGFMKSSGKADAALSFDHLIPTGRGGLMKRTFVFPDIGHIYIGPSTQPATPLIFCFRPNGTESQQKPFSSLRCARLGSAGRA